MIETHKSFADILVIACVVVMAVLVLCPPIFDEIKREIKWLVLTRKIRKNRK